MLLTVDVGNTNITCAVFEKKEIKTSFRLTTKQPRTSDEFGMLMNTLMLSNGLEPSLIDGIIVASVVPNIMHSLNNAMVKYFGIEPVIVEAGIRTGLKLNMENPRQVGADKIVDAVAAYEMYGGPVIVVDFGTATTFDFVAENGEFSSGVIAPGILASANALWEQTAQLPEVQIKRPKSILGKDTVSCMQAGLFFGQVGQIEYIIKMIKKECGLKECRVVATGGLGNIFKEETEMIDVYDPALTMHGLRIVYEKQKR